MRLHSLDYFRALAILLVVAGHSYEPWIINTFAERVLANMITGGTSLFVFISGFFFHYVYFQKFNYLMFLKKKIQQVFIPYLILSLAGISYYLLSPARLPFYYKLGIRKLQTLPDYLEMIAAYLWTGKITSSYWYIPFILILFVLSPIFIRYIKLSFISRIIIFLLLLGAAMLIHRPLGNLSPLHSVLYFMPIYLLGMLSSIHQQKIFTFIKGKTFLLALLVVMLSAAQIWLYDGYGNFHKKLIFSYNGIDIIIIQKIVLCFLLLSLLQKFEDKEIPVLKLLASASFAIYFIHPWMLLFFTTAHRKQIFYFLPEIAIFVATFVLVTSASLLVAYLIKRILKSKSHYLTGW